jgi:hypothetical protein
MIMLCVPTVTSTGSADAGTVAPGPIANPITNNLAIRHDILGRCMDEYATARGAGRQGKTPSRGAFLVAGLGVAG